MVRPQRGHRPLPAAQVVPQLEHWATPARPLPFCAGGQAYPLPLMLAPSTLSNAQEDCGNRGRLKNSYFLLCYL